MDKNVSHTQARVRHTRVCRGDTHKNVRHTHMLATHTRVFDAPVWVVDTLIRMLDTPARILDTPARVVDTPTRVRHPDMSAGRTHAVGVWALRARLSRYHVGHTRASVGHTHKLVQLSIESFTN